tara:strand:+ start:11 stop:628 length:618 start_codon:yes stop_codon:yes gene_type:complete
MRPLFGRFFHLQDVNFVDYLLLEDKQLLTHDPQFCQYHLNAQANHPPRCFAQPQQHEGNKGQKTLNWGNPPCPMINIPVTQWTFEHPPRGRPKMGMPVIMMQWKIKCQMQTPAPTSGIAHWLRLQIASAKSPSQIRNELSIAKTICQASEKCSSPNTFSGGIFNRTSDTAAIRYNDKSGKIVPITAAPRMCEVAGRPKTAAPINK